MSEIHEIAYPLLLFTKAGLELVKTIPTATPSSIVEGRAR
jgi:hypothetical protein